MNANTYGQDILRLRQRQGISLRELSRRADLSPASLSAIENGKVSPTLITLHKILAALGTSFAAFFTTEQTGRAESVFFSQQMQSIEGKERQYTMLLPKRDDIHVEMIREIFLPGAKRTTWETHEIDIAGTILQGGPLRLEIETQGEWKLNAGDAFYIKAGQKHRAINESSQAIRLLSVFTPPRY